MRLRNSVISASGTFKLNGQHDYLSEVSSLPRSVSTAWVMVCSFRVVMHFKSANVSPIVAGPNAIARPNFELDLRKLQRDLSSGCSDICTALCREEAPGTSRDRLFF